MKLTMKKTLMAAAIAAMAVSGAANAAMTTAQSGDSSLILTLLDNSNGVSATFDLGYSKSTFSQSTNNSWSLIGGDYAAAWTSFWSLASAATTQYSVFAGDALGSASGSQSMFTTVATTWANVSNTQLGTQQGLFDTYITANNALSSHNTVADGASVATQATGGAAYAGVSNAMGTAGKVGNAGGDTNVLIGNNVNVWNIVRNGTSGLTAATATKLSVASFNPYFNLSETGALTYTAVAAVPEADTYAMLLAGLGLMGFMARRRMSV